MKRKISFYLALTLMLSSAVLLFVFWNIFISREIEDETRAANTLISQITKTLENSEQADTKTRHLHEADALNRLHSAVSLIENRYTSYSPSDWQDLLSVLDVREVYIVDRDGIVTESSSADCIGVNLYTDESWSAVLPILNHDKQTLSLNGFWLTYTDDTLFLGAYIAQSDSTILLETAPDLKINAGTLSNTNAYFSSIPTKEYRTLFMINEEDGKILGISNNNAQTIQLDHPVETLKKIIGNPSILTVNGVKQLAVVSEYNGDLLGCFTKMDEIYSHSIDYLLQFALYLVILFAVMVALLYSIIDRLIIRDMEEIDSQLTMFFNGKPDVSFHACSKQTKEMSLLAESLDKVTDLFKARGARITAVATMLGDGFEAYEYYADLNQIYLSEKLPCMMGITEEECRQKIRQKFEEGKAMLTRESLELEEIHTTPAGRVLRIRRVLFKNLSYAFIEDITEAQKRESHLLKSLQKEKEKAYVDELTGLYNRKKVQETLEALNEQREYPEGIMMLLDLDNFKKVNDILGHHEGDRLLKLFAHLIKTQFRDSDIKARLGGDEFIVFMPNYMDQKLLERKAHRFLENARKVLYEYYSKYQLSVSIGISYMDQECDSFEALYKNADAAMYVAKRNGKDSFYINEEHNPCMACVCSHCRAHCARREKLFQEGTA